MPKNLYCVSAAIIENKIMAEAELETSTQESNCTSNTTLSNLASHSLFDLSKCLNRLHVNSKC